MVAKTTPAAAPTPALKAVVCVRVSGFCWFVWLAALLDPVLVVGTRFVVDADRVALDIETLEDFELVVELGNDKDDETRLETAEVIGVDDDFDDIETLEAVDTEKSLERVPAADELGAAELGATIDPVLVCSRPTTPMIVCAVPSETWNAPFPVSQLHIPSVMSGSQHHMLLPHGTTEPLLDETGSSKMTPYQL